VVLGPDMSNCGLLLQVADQSVTQVLLYDTDFGWIDSWELNVEAWATLVGRPFVIREGGPCPF
jgi:hypothetical protein